MIKPGNIVKSDSGRRIRVDGFIKAGGQGEAHWATDLNSNQNGVLKVFHQRFANAETVERVRFLVGTDLHSICPVLRGPVEPLTRLPLVGHYTPIARGKPLEEYLGNPDSTFLEQIQLALALAHALAEMHSRGIAHGDLHAENLFINHVGTIFEVQLIDFDNFNANGIPPPPCVGHNLYMAPELRKALATGRPAIPTVTTDLYSLGVLMHEIILLCHPSYENDESEADFQKAMCSGKWFLDPAATSSTNHCGYPTTILSPGLARLFRAACSLDPTVRPTSRTWESALNEAFTALYACPECGGPFVADASKTVCPYRNCRRPFPHLTLKLEDKSIAIPLVDGATVVGRDQLGGASKVSAHHVVFRRIGPETLLESTGSNGTFRWNGSKWVRLPDRMPLLVQSGDRIRFADVAARLS